MRLIHRCQFVIEHDLVATTKESNIDSYVKKFRGKKSNQMHKSDFGGSAFFNIFFSTTTSKCVIIATLIISFE